jgi:ATP-dependent DNA helicase PIF1
MWLQSNPSFQDFLPSIGEGATGNYVETPDSMVATGNSIEGLIHDIFGDGEHFDKRVILTVKNDNAQMINNKVLNLMPGDSNHCFSADYVNEEEAGTYPDEFLNTLQLSGLPPHDLELKNGQFVMLLRNLNPSRGFSNWSRMQLLSMSRNLLRGKLIEESMLEKKY